MFTGIIEEIGTVKEIRHSGESSFIKIQADKIFSDMHIGDSIAVNGLCLTVTEFNNNIFRADVMNETLKRSSLGSLKNGSPVNLERAMSAVGRFGGHIVSGHIDGTGIISEIKNDGIAIWYTVT
ncbi:MAG: riboflavin synthase, partial [Ruminococcus sp.]|nr:riboflavin synthase [Ruminococcus sp.]